MGLRNKLHEEALENKELMLAIEDIKTFYDMIPDPKLRVTDPDAYEMQWKRLREIRGKYTEVIRKHVEDNIDIVVDNVIGELSGKNYVTSDTFNPFSSPSLVEFPVEKIHTV